MSANQPESSPSGSAPPPPANHRKYNRSVSRSLLQTDMDMINKYATKYSPQSRTTPNSPYGGGGGGGGQTRFRGYSTSAASNGGMYAGMPPFSGYRSPTGMGSGARLPTALSHPQLMGGMHSKSSGYDDKNVDKTTAEMKVAMSSMIDSYASKLQSQVDFLDEIEAQAQSDPNFAKADRAARWSCGEVCHWLNKIHLDKYVRMFQSQTVDGSILLNDLDQDMIVRELGVKRLHVKKLLREIDRLKKLNSKSDDPLVSEVKELTAENEKLKAENKSLKDELSKLKK